MIENIVLVWFLLSIPAFAGFVLLVWLDNNQLPPVGVSIAYYVFLFLMLPLVVGGIVLIVVFMLFKALAYPLHLLVNLPHNRYGFMRFMFGRTYRDW